MRAKMWILGLVLFLLNWCSLQVTALNYRLDNSFSPTSYIIKLRLDNEFDTNLKFNGTTEITVSRIVDNAAVLHLHAAAELRFNKVSITDQKKTLYDLAMTYTNATEIWEIRIPTEMAAAPTLKVVFDYEGALTKDNRGFYISITDTSREVIATTQFQPTSARRAFPCFDEPSFKATFQLSLTVPRGYGALSNQLAEVTVLPNGVRFDFAETPEMSAYLLAFVVSKFEPKDVQFAKLTPMKIWAPKALIGSAALAAEVSYKIIESLSNALNKGQNVAFDEMGLQHLDQVAIPDFAAGAMENWGLVTYRQGKLLWNATESSLLAKENVMRVIAHEFSHSWFGNWVTTAWWSTAWLNEGFANYFEYHGMTDVAAARPFELHRQYIVNEMLPILETDAGNAALPLTSEANTLAEIQAKFGGITYSKGGSVLRMLQYLHGDAFLKHLNTYLYQYKNKAVVPTNLFKSFPSQGGVSTELLMKNWMEKPGYPVINVTTSSTANGTIVTLQQKQFFYKKPNATSTTEWYVPIWYQTVNLTSKQVSEAQFAEILKPGSNTTLKQERNTILIINPQHMGFYRVNYEESMWVKIAKVLSTNHSLIDVVTRTQLIDDALNLARAGQLSYDVAFELLDYLKLENNYFPWKSAMLSFSYLQRRLHGDEIWKSIAARINRLMVKLWGDYGEFYVDKDLPPVEVYAKLLALQWRCMLENEDCIEEAKQIYKQEVINPNLRPVVYCTALRHSEVNVTDMKDWQLLWAKYRESQVPNEKEVILSALGCTKNPAILRQFLEQSLNPDVVRQHDGANAFKSVLEGNEGHEGNADAVKVAIEFLDAKFRNIPQAYLTRALTLLGEHLKTEQLVAQFEAFVTRHQGDLKEDLKVAQAALATARENIAWTQNYKETLDNYFNAAGKGIYAGISYALAIVMCSMVMLTY